MPDATTPEGLAAATPGQAAYEAWKDHWAAHPAAGGRAAFDAVAHAVSTPLNAEIVRLRGQLQEAEDERDDLRTDYDSLASDWPKCPDGCGCRMGGHFADDRECGCGGPCTMECLENGYPDAKSYRDLAVAEAYARLGGVREIVFQGGQDGESVRRELIAYLTIQGDSTDGDGG